MEKYLKNINGFTIIIIGFCLFLIGCIYHRTPYFENSISTKSITFQRKNDTINSNRWYVDMVGNWILLDKNIVVQSGNTGIIIIKSDFKKI